MRIIALLLVAFSLHSCDSKVPVPLEKVAYDTVVSSKAFIDSEYRSHPECKSNAAAAINSNVCPLLAKAVAAKDLLIDATEEYCAGGSFNAGGACNPPAPGLIAEQATAKVNDALAHYRQIEADIKKVVE
jgi:hypothetical protein